MKFSELTRTSRLNEGYDLKAIKEQIASLFKGKLYTPPKVVMEDGTPVVSISTPVKHGIQIFKFTLSDDEKEVVIFIESDWFTLKERNKVLNDLKNEMENIEDMIGYYEDNIIEILKSK